MAAIGARYCGADGLYRGEVHRLASERCCAGATAVNDCGRARTSREKAASLGGMDRQTLRDWAIRFNEQPGAPPNISLLGGGRSRSVLPQPPLADGCRQITRYRRGPYQQRIPSERSSPCFVT